MNLPEFRREIEAAHTEFRQTLEAAAATLEKRLIKATQDFTADPAEVSERSPAMGTRVPSWAEQHP
jgi:hypothetical protein